MNENSFPVPVDTDLSMEDWVAQQNKFLLERERRKLDSRLSDGGELTKTLDRRYQ